MTFASIHAQDDRGSVGHIILIAALHIVLVVVPAVRFALPKPLTRGSWETGLTMAFISMSNDVMAPCSLVLQFFAQLLQMRKQHTDPGAMSLLSLFLQMLAMSFLSFRWFLRLGRPPWGWVQAEPRIWYQWAFPAVNYLMCAFVSGLLLICYIIGAD